MELIVDQNGESSFDFFAKLCFLIETFVDFILKNFYIIILDIGV